MRGCRWPKNTGVSNERQLKVTCASGNPTNLRLGAQPILSGGYSRARWSRPQENAAKGGKQDATGNSTCVPYCVDDQPSPCYLHLLVPQKASEWRRAKKSNE